MDIEFVKASKLKNKPQSGERLEFGKVFTDYIFTMKYTPDEGWNSAKIEPFSQLSLSPVSAVIHNAQSVYEGLKAFKNENGEILLYNPIENLQKLNRSADRLCMPRIDIDETLNGIKELLKADEEWMPVEEGKAMYIRVTMIGTDENLGENVSSCYLLYVVLSPANAYYYKKDEPMKVVVEENYSHFLGGLGAIKGGASSGEILKAKEGATKKGYDDVMWLDINRKYVEGVGQINVFFVEKDKIYTPELKGSVLVSSMRDDVIELLTAKNYDVKERNVTIKEVIKKLKKGVITEIFVAGAGVVKPVGTLGTGNKNYIVGDGKIGDVTKMIYDYITGVQFGRLPDSYHWTMKI